MNNRTLALTLVILLILSTSILTLSNYQTAQAATTHVLQTEDFESNQWTSNWTDAGTKPISISTDTKYVHSGTHGAYYSSTDSEVVGWETAPITLPATDGSENRTYTLWFKLSSTTTDPDYDAAGLTFFDLTYNVNEDIFNPYYIESYIWTDGANHANLAMDSSSSYVETSYSLVRNVWYNLTLTMNIKGTTYNSALFVNGWFVGALSDNNDWIETVDNASVNIYGKPWSNGYIAYDDFQELQVINFIPHVGGEELEFITNGGFEIFENNSEIPPEGSNNWYATTPSPITVVDKDDYWWQDSFEPYAEHSGTILPYNGTKMAKLGYTTYLRQNLTLAVPAEVTGTVGAWLCTDSGASTGLFSVTLIYSDDYQTFNPYGWNGTAYTNENGWDAGSGYATMDWQFYNFTDLINANIDRTQNIIAIQIENRADLGNLLVDDVTVMDDPLYYQLEPRTIGTGTISPSETSFYIANIQVPVTVTSGSLLHWLLNGTEVGSSSTYNVELTDNYVLTAIFDDWDAAPSPTPIPTDGPEPTTSTNPHPTNIPPILIPTPTPTPTDGNGHETYNDSWLLRIYHILPWWLWLIIIAVIIIVTGIYLGRKNR
jgi:hypothetical protein